MYLKTAVYKNVGPITNVEIQFPFFDNGSPKPVILVGENGSGKSTILSNIVDSFYEIAGVAYNNAHEQESGNAYQYFKAISPNEIHIGNNYMISYLSFEAESGINYIHKSGDVSFEKIKDELALPDSFSWKQHENKKACLADKSTIEKEWSSNVICYFGPDRYEKPFWMGDKYYETTTFEHPSVQKRWSGKLYNPISIKNVTAVNLQWLLDVIADSRADIKVEPDGAMSIEHALPQDLLLLRHSRTNIETIMSRILGEEVFFRFNFRSSHGSRFTIIREKDNTVICPTLDSLSTGQIALFNLFATIVRYADANDINKSIHLSDIKGIVVIDEIELHLHARLQKEVLPALMKLFPKIQFIVTSHAPLFLLGMREEYGDDGFDVLELPEGCLIGVEKFGEFNNAYQYLTRTELYQADINRVINELKTRKKTIVVTEGSTDWKHIKAAWNSISKDERYLQKFANLDFELLEYAPINSGEELSIKLEMGKDMLEKICESSSKIPHETKYIFIADNDDRNINRKMNTENERFKNWGNNVFSFTLPVPHSRKDTPMICIEHLYSDEEIKTEYDNEGIIRRLYMGYEFDERGVARELDHICEKKSSCGKGKINIIDGSNDDRVTSIDNEANTNYALTKSKFASLVLNRTEPFDKFNFDNFVPLFERIQSINEID